MIMIIYCYYYYYYDNKNNYYYYYCDYDNNSYHNDSIGLQNHVKDMEDICVSASKEHNLQVAMDKMENEWKNMAFDTKEYRNSGTRVLSSTDEIQQLLDDQIVKTQSMKGSRFIGPFLERITIWEDTLVTLQDVLDNWIKVQSTWLYLEPIFSSDDIMRQMPAEGKMFQVMMKILTVGGEYVLLMI